MIEKTVKLLEMTCLLSGASSGVILEKQNDNLSIFLSYSSLESKEKIFSTVNPILNNIEFKKDGYFELNFDNEKAFLFDVGTSAAGIQKLLLILSDKEIFTINSQNAQQFIKSFKENLNYGVNEYLLQNPFANINAAMLFTDENGAAVTANDAFFELFGIKSKSLSDFRWSNYKFFDEFSKIVEIESLPFFRINEKSESISNFKVKLFENESPKFWLSINTYLISGRGEETKLSFNLFEDISQFMETESRLREAAEKIDSVLYSTDASGRHYHFISGAAEKILGYPKEQIVHRKFILLRAIMPEDIGLFKQFVASLNSGKESTVEYRITDRFGNEKFLRHTGIPIVENGDIVRIVGIISDISTEKNILEKLQQSEQQFRLLIETAEDLIFMLDNYGYFKMVNRNGAQSLGFRTKEMIGKHFLEFIEEGNKSDIAVSFQRILSSEDVVSFEGVFSDKLGKKKIFEIQARHIKEDGETNGMLGIGRDFTERKKDESKLKDLNSKLIEANRLVSIERDRAKHQVSTLEELNKLKNEFISNVSHELRTPLASIVGFAESLVSDPDLPPDMVSEFNNIILTEGKRLARLINDVLDFSQLDSDKGNLRKNKFDIIILLKELVESFRSDANKKEITISAEIPEAEVIIFGDRDRITKAIANIFSNAIKFTDKGGRIRIIVNDFLKEFELIISDTGIGIPEDDIPHLFEKFRKVNRPGSQLPGAGFGLVTVKQIIDLHKGLIRIQSEIDKGTTVVIKLPKL